MSSEKHPFEEDQANETASLVVGGSDSLEHSDFEQTAREISHHNAESSMQVELMPGHILHGKYEIISKLGSGGMGIVYKARDIALNRPVAVKTFTQSGAGAEKGFLRFQQEARAAGALQHESIVGVHEFNVSTEGLTYLVMDFVDGIPLSELIRSSGQLPLHRCLEITLKTADAVSHAHGKGVIHRDLKPANIMLVRGNRATEAVKIVDFGIAKIHTGEGASSMTKTGEVFGSPLYMSPEQCAGQKVDQRSDIYSLGCVLYETLVGRLPHRGENALATALMHLREEPLLLSAVRQDIQFSHELQLVLDKAMAKDLSPRYQSMSEFCSDLRALQEGKQEALVEMSAVSKRRRILNTVKQRAAIPAGLLALVCASFASNPTLTGFLYLFGGLLLVFSIPGLKGGGPLSLELQRQS